MVQNITLSAPITSNWKALQNTARLILRTEERLLTGLKIQNPTDGAVAFFQAESLSKRGMDFAEKQDGINQAISSVGTALTAIASVESILKQMKGVLLSAKSSTDSERRDLEANFGELARQVNTLSNDASYQGLNLINSTATMLRVNFSTAPASFLLIEGQNIQISGLFICTADNAAPTPSNVGLHLVDHRAWSLIQDEVSLFDRGVRLMDSALTSLRSVAKSLGSNVAVLQARLDFTKTYINTLTEGSDKLTLADMNEEGANLVALQTRLQLGLQALQFSGQSDQSIIQLLR